MCINGIFIVVLLDMGVDVSIITPISWHLNWPLQEVDDQFMGIGILSQVRQNMRWVKYIGPVGQVGKQRTYIANIVVNLWGHELL